MVARLELPFGSLLHQLINLVEPNETETKSGTGSVVNWLDGGRQTRASQFELGHYFTSSIDLVEHCITGQGHQPNGVDT